MDNSEKIEEFLLSLNIPFEFLSHRDYEELLPTLNYKWKQVCSAMGLNFNDIKHLEAREINDNRQRYTCNEEKVFDCFLKLSHKDRSLTALYKYFKEAKVEIACHKLCEIMTRIAPKFLDKCRNERKNVESYLPLARNRNFQSQFSNDTRNGKRKYENTGSFHDNQDFLMSGTDTSGMNSLFDGDESMDYETSLGAATNLQAQKYTNCRLRDELFHERSNSDGNCIHLDPNLMEIYTRPEAFTATFPYTKPKSKKKSSQKTLNSSLKSSSLPSGYLITQSTSLKDMSVFRSRVLIVYESSEKRHVDEVKSIACWLKKNKFRVEFDLEKGDVVRENRGDWLKKVYAVANFILLCITPHFEKRVEKGNDKALKDIWNDICMRMNKDSANRVGNAIVPLLISPAKKIPKILQSIVHYKWKEDWQNLSFYLSAPYKLPENR